MTANASIATAGRDAADRRRLVGAGAGFAAGVWFAGLLGAVCPAPAQKLDSPAGSVELVPYAAANTTWSVLLNHGGEQLASGGPLWPRTVAPLPAYRVRLEGSGP